MQAQPPRHVHVRVPGKINLQLSVGPLREDGYHELATVFAAIGLFDTVTMRPAARLRLSCSGPYAAGVPLDETNLAARAALLLGKQLGQQPQVSIHLDKQIPVAGGMAGGSADAAAVLLGLAHLWREHLGNPVASESQVRQLLLPLAAQLGSDVAFPLLGGVAVGTGRGEHLRPVACPVRLWWVVATARGQLSTPAVFSELDRQRSRLQGLDKQINPPQPDVALLRAVAEGQVDEIAARLHNDLQPAAVALMPQVQHTLMAGLHSGALAALVSGSGPTCLFLARDQPHAQQVAAHVADLPQVGHTLLAPSPTLGAHLHT